MADAIRAGDADKVTTLLEQGANPLHRNIAHPYVVEPRMVR